MTPEVVLQDASEKSLNVASPLSLQTVRPKQCFQLVLGSSKYLYPRWISEPELPEHSLVHPLAGVQTKQDVNGLSENIVEVSQVRHAVGHLKELGDSLHNIADLSSTLHRFDWGWLWALDHMRAPRPVVPPLP